MIVELSAEAEHDLEAIGDFIAHDSPARALRFIEDLRGQCLGLSAMPERFPLVAGYETFGVRRRVYRDYLIFYRVEPAKVVVIHILHGARDYGRLFSDPEQSL